MRSEVFWDWFDNEARPKLKGRAGTFGKMFEHLDQFEYVTIIETGCARRDPAIDESWGLDGCSTYLFDRYVRLHPGSLLYTIDIDEEATDRLRKVMFRPDNVLTGDSVATLREIVGGSIIVPTSVDLLYLDSFDFEAADPLPSAIHHHAELMVAMPMLRPDSLVVVDDSPATYDDESHAEVGGKGMLVAKHMALAGADMLFCSYQTGWTNVGPARRHEDADLADMVERARGHVEADSVLAAEQIYRVILGNTTPPRTGQARVAHGEACAFYGRLALARQKFGAAADWYREALMADPLATDYRLDLCVKCFMPMGNLKAALVEAERATRISPEYPATWRVLGGIQHELGNVRKCIEAYDRQIALDPTDPNALLDRATIALDMSEHDLVRELCAGVEGTDRAADALHCLAMVAYREHRHEDAIELYDQAIAAGCRDQPVTHWNKSLALHAIGRYREGWVEHENREFQKSNPALYLPMRRFTIPRWKGEPALKYDGTQAIIHVHYEAGAGDNLACVRYLRELTERGYKVRYETADEMVDLMRTSFPDVMIMPKAADYPGALGIPAFDYHVPIGSLPAVFGTEVDTVPWSGPYISADPALVEKVKLNTGGTPVVGLCWSSGIRDGVWMGEFGRRKSMHFDTVWPIVVAARRCGKEIISLQVGPERAQHNGQILDLLPKRPTWSETAALIANLDLVITVDTAVAHLAGAMGKPVWLMCQRDATSWHFLCWRPDAPWNERSPWYPSMKIFRQREFDRPHHWSDVVAEIAEELRR